MYLEQESFADAVDLLERCLAITLEADLRHLEGRTRANLARSYVGLNRFEEAETALRQSLGVFNRLGDRYAVGQVLKIYGLGVSETGSSIRSSPRPGGASGSCRPPVMDVQAIGP